MSLWNVIARRVLGKVIPHPVAKALDAGEMQRLRAVALTGDGDLIREAVVDLAPAHVSEVAREVLRERVREAIDILQHCQPCHALLSGGGYDPVALLDALGQSIGRRFAQMDIAPGGGGGSQRGQGYMTQIRFGPRDFLLGTSLAGMTIRESQLQVILHELAHAAGDVIPPDGGDAQESLRNQHRITRACLPETYERINATME